MAQKTLEHRQVVGAHVTRGDAWDKVTGKAQYTNDMQLPGMLHLALVPSTCPAGRIVSVDASAALALPGVKAVLTATDLWQSPIACKDIRYGPVVRDRPILAEGVVRYIGEPVAVVAATDVRTAREAARLVLVAIDPTPASTTLEEALAAAAPLVHDREYDGEDGVYKSGVAFEEARSNIMLRFETKKGDVAAAFQKAHRVFEGTYTFPSIYHYAMEPYCCVAQVSNEQLTVWSSAQHPYQVEKDLSRLFGYPISRTRVVASYLGGGFGSKSFTHVEPIAVAASKYTGLPCKLELDITQSMMTSRRHGAWMKVRSAVDAEGNILGYDSELYYEGGAYALLGPYVAQKGAFRNLGGYDFPAYRVRSHEVYVHTSPAGSFRAIGGPQGAWALEAHLDEVASAFGLDKIEFRRRLVAGRGVEFRAGRLPMDADLGEDLDRLKALVAAAEPKIERPGAPWKTGFGTAMGVCDPGASPVSTALVRLSADGSVTVVIGSSELGQGVRTVMCQVAAEVLGVAYEKVIAMQTDTGYGPYDASTGASRSTVFSGLATQRAAEAVKMRLARMAAREWDCPMEDVRFEGGEVSSPRGDRKALGQFVQDFFGQAGGNFWGVGEVTNHEFPKTPAFWEVSAAACTVAVDTETGKIKILAYQSVADMGKVINPLMMEGQEMGALMQGIGHTLSEGLVWENGQLINSSIIDYKVPYFTDIPVLFDSGFVENGDGPGPFGAKGGGEGPVVPAAGAIASALHDAVGVRVYDLPLTPERVWRALAAAGAARDFGA